MINPLNAELNPICHLLALVGGATIVVVSRLIIKHVSKNNKKTACSFVMSLWPQTTGSEQTTGSREEKYALLGHYAASSGNSVQKFRDNLSGPIFKGFFEFLTIENWTDILSRNVGKELPLLAA